MESKCIAQKLLYNRWRANVLHRNYYISMESKCIAQKLLYIDGEQMYCTETITYRWRANVLHRNYYISIDGEQMYCTETIV